MSCILLIESTKLEETKGTEIAEKFKQRRHGGAEDARS
jgi:hypothetical protein